MWVGVGVCGWVYRCGCVGVDVGVCIPYVCTHACKHAYMYVLTRLPGNCLRIYNYVIRPTAGPGRAGNKFILLY